MALQSLHQSFLHHHHHPLTPYHETTTNLSFFFKPTKPTRANNLILFSNLSSSPSPSSSSSSSLSTTPTTSTKTTPSLELLAEHLSAQNYRQADEVTRRLLIVLAGEAAQKRGYVFFSEVQFISPQDLREIDQLWRKHSNGRFGYSIQKKLFEKSRGDFTKFFIQVRWMKKLDTEIEQYNYRAFPDEFIWELNDETPLGHLPLTNALRGTQLLASIFDHPAFEEEENGGEESEGEEEREKVEERGKEMRPKLLDFKADYSF